MSMWHGNPLVLASRSQVRRHLLEAAGIPVVVDPAEIDERRVEASEGGRLEPDGAALLLAREKALTVSHRRPQLVLGADQTLSLAGRRFCKPGSKAEARDQLKELAGKTHVLHSAAAIARDGLVAFETVSAARLSMRTLSDAALDAYLAATGPRVTQSVGAYQLEGLGVNLFEKIEGDHFTVLGLPLLALLAHFRSAGLMP